MAEFGQNGQVISAPTAADYAAAKPKIKRVALACFLCGVAACLAVTLVALIIMAIGRFVLMIDPDDVTAFSGGSLLGGAGFALILSAFNWFVFYITVPAAWLAIGLSLGTFPHKRITAPAPYYRWAAIWGAILVGGTCAVFSGMVAADGIGNDAVTYWLGATLMGTLIGALAGLICGGLFRAIVRPATQVTRHQVDVF